MKNGSQEYYMEFKRYFNVSHTHPRIDAIKDIDQKTGEFIEAECIDVHANEIILRGYLDAADVIVHNCENHYYFINIDGLLFPVLFIYVSLIEYCIKIILNKIIEHKDLGCPFLLIPTQDISKNHKLKDLLQSLKKIFKENKILPSKHKYKEIKLLEHIINEFEKNHIESVTIRYLTNHRNKLYDIYKNDLTCNFKMLHEDIKKITESTINYICSSEFSFCSANEYTFNRYNELNKSYELMIRFKKITSKYRRKYNLSEKRRRQTKIKRGEDPDYFTASDVDFSLLNYRQYYDYKDFNDKELNLLVLGVYFSRYPFISMVSVEYYNAWSKEHKIQLLDERVMILNKAILGLRKHIQRVEKVINKYC